MHEQVLQVITVIGAIGGALGTAYSGWRWCLKPISNFIKNLSRVCDALPQIEKDLDGIKAELKPNCGMSLRDVINRIEKSLLIEKHARHAMSMAVDVAMFETDEFGKCTWVNHTYTDITGMTTDEALGFGWVSSIYEEDRDRVSEEWKDVVEEKRSFHMKYRMINIKDEKVTSVKCDSFPIANEVGNLVGHVGIITVIPNEV